MEDEQFRAFLIRWARAGYRSDSRTEVVNVDGANCWGSEKMRMILIGASDYFQGARNVCIESLQRRSRHHRPTYIKLWTQPKYVRLVYAHL